VLLDRGEDHVAHVLGLAPGIAAAAEEHELGVLAGAQAEADVQL
jgi:hypothetical protein